MKRFANLPGLGLFGEPQWDETNGSADVPPKESAPAQTGEEATSDAGKNKEETRKRFRSLMEGEYKDEFTAYFNEIFARRFKEQKSLTEELTLARSVVKAAEERYGVSGIGDLLVALRTDTEDRMSSRALATDSVPAGEAKELLDVRLEEAVAEAVARARSETERAMMETIRARGMRPAENALSALSFGGTRRDAVHLTRAERAEVAMRAAKGEHIEL